MRCIPGTGSQLLSLRTRFSFFAFETFLLFDLQFVESLEGVLGLLGIIFVDVYGRI